MNRRGFFARLLGLGAVPAAMVADTHSRERAELLALRQAFLELRAEMERPITLTVELDGRKLHQPLYRSGV
jgi:hypothetical protein